MSVRAEHCANVPSSTISKLADSFTTARLEQELKAQLPITLTLSGMSMVGNCWQLPKEYEPISLRVSGSFSSVRDMQF